MRIGLLPGAIVVLAALAAARADEARESPAGTGATTGDDATWAAVPVVRLHEAVAARTVEASGSDPSSYRAVRLHLRNRTRERIAVDIAGSHLRPKGARSCQRLGLGPAVTPSATVSRGAGTAIVLLEPEAETAFGVNTCCLDAGLPAPSRHEFTGVGEALPEVREKVLRWWVDHPTAPQGAVNSAIWQSSPEVRVDPGVVENFVTPKGRYAAVRGGTYYRLTEGELTSLDETGLVRILATGVFQVLPADDALYAVMLGTDGKPKLWRLGVTGDERWTKVVDLDGTNRIREIVPGLRGDLCLVTDKGVQWFDRESGTMRMALETTQTVHLSARREGASRMTITNRRPPRAPTYQGGEPRDESSPVFELWDLDLATGKAERAEQYWNQGAVLAGPGGVFALSHTQGRLRRLTGGRFTDVGPDAEYRRILAVAREVLWLVDAEDRVVSVDAKSGRLRFRTEIPAKDFEVFRVDPGPGDLAYVHPGGFGWVRAADGTDVSVDPR